MNLNAIDWKAVARDFCREHNTLDVATAEKAIRHGAGIAVDSVTENLKSAISNLETKRLKANSPQ